MSAAEAWIALFPLLAAAIAGVFAWRLARRFAERRRPHEGVWAVAMLMYALASLAMAVGVLAGWGPFEYRVYWLLGAALNVPFLAQGEVYLLVRDRRVAHGLLAALVFLSVASTWIVWAEPVRPGALAETLPLGREAWGDASPAYQLRWLSWIGYVALLAGLVWSARKMRGRPELRNRTVGVLAIAFGATIVAAGSGVGAGFGLVPLFSISLAAGIAVMFWGFVRAGAPAVSRAPTPTGSSSGATGEGMPGG